MRLKFKTRLSAILLAIFTAYLGQSQVATCASTNTSCNYVTNGGFETNQWNYEDPDNPGNYIADCSGMHYTGGNTPQFPYCPFLVCNWFDNPNLGGATPDYFNSCASSTDWGLNGSVNAYSNFISNNIGAVGPHTGDGYAGIYVREDDNPYYNETVNQTLNTPLVLGKTYLIGMWVRLGHVCKYACTFNANICGNIVTFTNSPVTDKNNWTYISTCFTPNVITNNNIEIGSYGANTIDLDPSNLWSYSFPATYNGWHEKTSYYYIDDVSIIPLNVNAGSDIQIYNGCAATIGQVTATSFPCMPNGSSVSYNWFPNTSLSSENTATTIASPSITTTYTVYATVTYTNEAGLVKQCSSFDEITVHVVTPTLTIVPSATCNTNGSHSFSVTVNPSTAASYIWSIKDALTNTIVPINGTGLTSSAPVINFQNITRNVYVCAVAVNSVGCQSSPVCFYYPNCCPTNTAIVKYANTTYSTVISPTSTQIAYGGTITVNSGGVLLINSKEVYMEPNTKFIVNGTGRIVITNSYLHACTDMWDGIYINGANSVNSISKCRVEDAKRVIVDSLGTASFNLIGNYFNKNYIGVIFKATKSSTSNFLVKNNLFTSSNIPVTVAPYNLTTNPVIPLSSSVSLANASIFGAYTSASLKAPYNIEKPKCGIMMQNASHVGKSNSAIAIGAATGEENVFDKMQYGVFQVNSNAVYNSNVFQNIKSTIAPNPFSTLNAGIFIWGGFIGDGPYYSSIGNYSLNLKNTFKDNDFGVANIYQSGLIIENNRFENQGTGVAVAINNNNSTVNVASNKFINNKIGINFDQNTNINATISLNWFDNTTAQGTYADNFAIRATEAVPPTNTLNYAKYAIYNNYINGYYNGILTTQTYKSVINDNEVHVRPDNTSYNFQSAIQIIASNDNDVYNNTTDYPSGTKNNWWQYNIFTAGSTVPKIHCNNTNFGGVGIIANGLNYTAGGNGIYGNTMQNHEYGFWLNSAGEIGDQYYLNGSTVYSADNRWDNVTYETFSNAGCNQVSGAKFYTRSANPYKINNPTNGGTTGVTIFGTNNSTGYTGACYGGVATPTLALRLAGGNTQKLLMQKADDIATDKITFTENNISLKQIARNQLFSNIALQQIDPNVTLGINTFVNSAKQNNLTKYAMIDSLINTGDSLALINAFGLNSQIKPSNIVDETQQDFNQQYITYLQNKRKQLKLTVSDLEAIAALCPNINGHAVYQARSVLFNLTKKQYNNTCEKSTKVSKRFANAIIDEVAAVNVKLFPNPSNGNITLQTNDELNYNITVYNLLGERVFESIALHNQSINLANLASATYIVHILQNGNLIKTERINIIH